jgi:hypothetical protein
MPEDNKMNTEDNDIVDIDTTGPSVDVELQEEVSKEEPTEIETKEEVSNVTEVAEDTKEDTKEVKKEEPENEHEDYSEGVQKRIAKLTRKMREAERQREAAIEYAQSVQSKANVTQAKLSKLEPGYLQSVETGIKSGYDAAAAKLAAAREAGDITAEIEAQKEISKLGVQEANLEMQKNRYSEQSKKIPALNATETTDTYNGYELPKNTPVDAQAEDWAAENPWFGTDNAMTYTAFDLHKKLTEQEGFDPKSKEYYSEINKRIRLEFPHKFGNSTPTESAKPTQVVASAKRSVKPGRKTVRLTPSQVSIAKKLGVPLEEYAKQLNITKEI